MNGSVCCCAVRAAPRFTRILPVATITLGDSMRTKRARSFRDWCSRSLALTRAGFIGRGQG